jgi:hypothetical protein
MSVASVRARLIFDKDKLLFVRTMG